MNIPLNPELVVFARVRQFLIPRFFATPITGGEDICLHVKQGSGINTGSDGKLQFYWTWLRIPVNRSGAVALVRFNPEQASRDYLKSCAWCFIEDYESAVKLFNTSHPEAPLPFPPKVEAIEQKIIGWPVLPNRKKREAIELPKQPPPIIQNGRKSKYRTRKMRQFTELCAALRAGEAVSE